MKRFYWICILMLLIAAPAGCRSEPTPPADPSPDEAALEIPDAELQQREEDAFRERQEEAQSDASAEQP
jgi:hypothetical protein